MKVFAVLISIFLSSHSLAKEPIGEIVEVLGKVIRSNLDGSGKKQMKTLDKIYEGSILTTEVRSYAKVLMNDNSNIRIGPKTTFSFEKFKMNAKTQKREKATYFLKSGNMRAIFLKKNNEKARNITIKTRTAAMGVRGTEIIAEAGMVNGSDFTEIVLVEGQLVVKELKGKLLRMRSNELYSSIRSQRNAPVISLPREMSLAFSSNRDKGSFTFIGELKDRLNMKMKKINVANRKERKKVRGVAQKIDSIREVALSRSEGTSSSTLLSTAFKQIVKPSAIIQSPYSGFREDRPTAIGSPTNEDRYRTREDRNRRELVVPPPAVPLDDTSSNADDTAKEPLPDTKPSPTPSP